jgi:hypothetical protein
MITFYWLRFETPSNGVGQLYPQTLDSLFIASYYLQGYDGGIDPASTWDMLNGH